MKYWDASALVPLVVAEPGTAEVRAVLRADPEVVTWGWSLVEIVSAVERRAREGRLDMEHRRLVLDRFERLAQQWDEVVDPMAVRARALGVLARHDLRAADAGQLAAALVVNDGGPAVDFVCLDRRLSLAAEREGLRSVGLG